jgi:TolB-like protein/Tfp pilus assembly protein PilF/tRNA A-37 threonylcarbamoyl transferase component Bud32
MIGQTLAHYRVIAAIGAGGMGEVYRATDTKLGRDVALKVLPPDVARDPERLARFQREARAIAALNHPHIVTIFSVEETGGVHFLTMELVEGQSLDRLISASGLSVEQIVQIASALADALAAAHEKGIVHRDLKPANVMVTNDGRVKVLDFGLAKDVRTDNSSDATLTSAGRTQAGIVMGTPAYMSPEQVAGRPLDHRTDIFSLGIILYEMATGRRPFEGTSSAELASAILRDNPAAITSTRADLPSDLTRIIRRCLEKDPRHRVQTARDISNEFRDLERQSSQAMAVPVSRAAVAPPVSGATRADEGFWVAVLPFKYTGGNAELTALADGLTDDVLTGLSRFSYLRVIARGSTAKYSSESGDIRAIGKELGARYVMEGSLRLAGSKVRIAVQLVDASSGAGLWAETYDRPFTSESTLDLLDDVVPRIVATVGDTQGILPHSMTAALRNRDPESLTPYEAMVRSFGYHQRVNPSEHLVARTALERAVKQEPDRADCWAMLSWIYRGEYTHGFNPLPDPLDRSLAAARRALDLAPSNPLAHVALASVLFCRHEVGAFRTAAERALSLNRMEGYATAYLGLQMAFAGDWEAGCAVVERATQLNPNHPGWFWLPLAFNAYRQQDGQRALEFVLKINMPGLWLAQIALAVVRSQLGEREAAGIAVRDLLALRPDFAANVDEELSKWWQPDLASRILADLRKAGLEIPEQNARPVSAPASTAVAANTTSGAARAAEGFWVAVLPFKYTGNNADLTALVEGLTADIVTGLSRFSYLKVIARGSTAKYSSESGDVRAIGKELGARFVMEGNLRQAGTKLRLAVQLVDATSGAHLWAENFERTFSPESVFALQDELVPRIVSTVADAHGILPHTMSEAIRGKSPEQLTPYEAVLRGFSYAERISPEEHAIARTALERAVQVAPSYAYAWAMLSIVIVAEHQGGFNPQPNPLERALQAARRAIELDSSGHRGYQALALVLFFRKEMQAFRTAAEKAIALNPMDGCNIAHLGSYIAYAGEWERGCALVEHALQLNPNHPGWFWFPLFFNAYRKRDYHGALSYALKVNLPSYYGTHMALAAAYAQLGQQDEARKALQELLKLQPDAARIARPTLSMTHDPELVEHMIDGLRQAGLEIPDDLAKPATAPPSPASAKTRSGATRTNEGFWVAVLPFKYTGTSAELKSLADGLSEEVITGLSRFSYLRVIARGSTAKYFSESGDVRAIGKELGARYVMEGSLRQAGNKLRLAVQLVDAVSGAHLWAETYERAFNPEAVFELQDDLVPRIVSTVADQYGILPRSMSEVLRTKKEGDLTPSEAVLRTFSYFTRITPEEHATVGKILERAVRDAPDHADSWAMLSMIYRGEFAQGFNAGPNPLDRALAAAQRAVDLAATHALGHYALATVYFFRKEMVPFRVEAERALALNPLDASVRAYLGLLIAAAGEWDRGCQMVESAMQLNPNCPGFFYFAGCCNAYRQGRYAEVLEGAARVNMPGYFHVPALQAAALGQLGRREEARKVVRDLLALRPDFATAARTEYGKWYDAEQVEMLVEGLRKAGLEVPDDPAKPSASPVATTSGATRADEGFWVAVLPFKYTGSNADLTALVGGLTEDTVTGLSRFSYLRVIARGSTAKYSSESGDVRTIGKELGARYVMEGSLRQAGTKLRLAVQLVDAATGAHLWAENYERDFKPETVFALQDDLVPRIVSTVADMNGVLAHSMSEVVRSRSPEELSPYEAVLRGFGYLARITPEDLTAARSALELVVQKSPAYADAWAMLALLCVQDHAQGFNLQADALSSALTAARRAVDAGPSNPLAYGSLAQALFFQKEFPSFRNAVERAVALNPMDGNSMASLGAMLAYSGDWERGLALAGRAKQLNPNHPGWYWFVDFSNSYRQRDYRGALSFVTRINMPRHWSTHVMKAAACGQLGERDAAGKALQEMLKPRPDFATTIRKDFEKWWDHELSEHLIDGLRKAGLKIAAKDGSRPTKPRSKTKS